MASHDAVSEREELELKVKFAGAVEGTEIKQTYSHYIISWKDFHDYITCRYQIKSLLSEAVFLPDFVHWEPLSGRTERLKEGGEGEKQVTFFRYS